MEGIYSHTEVPPTRLATQPRGKYFSPTNEDITEKNEDVFTKTYTL